MLHIAHITDSSKISGIALFYRRYSVASLIMTAVCAFLFLQDDDIAQCIAIKTFTTPVIMFFIATLQQDQLYYYYNQHLSRRSLFAGYFIADLFLFNTTLWLTTLMHR